MLPSPELQMFISSIALALIGVVWLISASWSGDRLSRIGNIVGGLGAGIAALGISSFLKPVTSVSAQAIMGIWLASLCMLLAATLMVSMSTSKLRWGFTAVGVFCLLMNLWTVLLFLFIATVSAGGV